MTPLIVWPKDYKEETLRNYYNNGINGLFINPESYDKGDYGQTLPGKSVEQILWEMKYIYDKAREIGLTYFLIDVTWGLYPIDQNDLWVRVYKQFKDDPKVRFECEELFTNLIDNKSACADGRYLLEDEVVKLILEKRKVIGSRLFLGDTFRWLDRYSILYYIATPTAYEIWGQLKWIKKNQPPYVWIYGGLKPFADLRYKTIKKNLHPNTWICLYQGDQPGWTWEGFLLKIWDARNYLAERFTKIFAN